MPRNSKWCWSDFFSSQLPTHTFQLLRKKASHNIWAVPLRALCMQQLCTQYRQQGTGMGTNNFIRGQRRNSSINYASKPRVFCDYFNDPKYFWHQTLKINKTRVSACRVETSNFCPDSWRFQYGKLLAQDGNFVGPLSNVFRGLFQFDFHRWVEYCRPEPLINNPGKIFKLSVFCYLR